MLVPLIAAGLLCGVATAAAQSCGGEIDRLAQQYNLSSDDTHTGSSAAPETPTASAATQGVTTTEKLARSGGVISPPDTGTSMAIQPPRSNPDRMPTAPDVAPSPPAGSSSDASGLTASERSRMESLLAAARSAERQGKNEQCLDRLREAEAVPAPAGARVAK